MTDHEHHARTRWLRKSDLVSIGVIVTLCGALWAAIQRPVRWERATQKVEERTETWDQASRDIAEIKPKVQVLEQHYASMDARNSAQMALIIRELDGIHKELSK